MGTGAVKISFVGTFAILSEPCRTTMLQYSYGSKFLMVKIPNGLKFFNVGINVPKPDPHPEDPCVFGPPGSASGSVIFLYRSGSFHLWAQRWRKTLITTFLWLFYDFISLKNDINVPSKRNKNKNLANKNKFLLASWRSLPKRAGSRAGSGVGSASGSVCQRYRYGSETKISRIRNTGRD
jgi:hypothetical protein